MRDATEQYLEDVERDTFRQRQVMASLLKTYLVGLEWPWGSAESIVKVTDDHDGFGDLLTKPPVERVDAESAADAGWDYALRHQLFPILAIVNLPDEHGEWQLTAEGKYEREEEE
jgi:hypothetical protein